MQGPFLRQRWLSAVGLRDSCQGRLTLLVVSVLERDWERKRLKGWEGFTNPVFGRKAAEWALDGGNHLRSLSSG